MALDKVIIKNLDAMEILEEGVDKDIESILKHIKIEQVMTDPEGAMMQIVEEIKSVITEDYYQDAISHGAILAADIEEDGDIKVSASKDPNLNEDLLDERKD